MAHEHPMSMEGMFGPYSMTREPALEAAYGAHPVSCMVFARLKLD